MQLESNRDSDATPRANAILSRLFMDTRLVSLPCLFDNLVPEMELKRWDAKCDGWHSGGDFR